MDPTTRKRRAFDDTDAKRAAVQLLIGLIGPSFSGKTCSALRLATGMQEVTGGEIFYIDTESRRALHYADTFKFKHVEFRAPFGPLDYLDAIEHCVKRGARVLIIDSMSHEHEGPGGVLEMHARELERLGGSPKMSMLAWQKPKQERRRLINTILQLPVSCIFCFRAKEKLKLESGKDPVPLGFMAIAGDEFTYEMTVSCMLLPGAGGEPSWESREVGEKMMIKLPWHFREMLLQHKGPLDETIGHALAEWAAGGAAAAPPARPATPAVTPTTAPAPSEVFGHLLTRILGAGTHKDLGEIAPIVREHKEKRTLPEPQVRDLLDGIRARLAVLDREAAAALSTEVRGMILRCAAPGAKPEDVVKLVSAETDGSVNVTAEQVRGVLGGRS